MQLADRVMETSTTTGTGTLTLAGAKTGYRTFAAGLGSASVETHYCITDGTDWEVGIGVFNGTSTLTRATILASSNSNNAVNWGAGTRDVFVTATAKAIVNIGPTTARAHHMDML
jgi:hypothetical protein